MMTLKEQYLKEVAPALQKQFGYKNQMAVPRIVKVVLNVGISSGQKDQKYVETVKETLRMISGQEPQARGARKSISNFKIRAGQTVGLRVTLRGPRMYHFLEKLIRITFPRSRDFRGLAPTTFDARGNFTLGLREAVAFPEIKAGELSHAHGIEIGVVTTAKNKEEGLALLKQMGFPFRDK